MAKDQNLNSQKISKPQTMADLMKSVKTSFVVPKKGEVMEGVITKLTASEILVDIGAKTEATVLEKDKKLLRTLLSQLKIGDKVEISVLNPESDMGNPVVSLRRFMDEKIWSVLSSLEKEKKQLEVTIDESTKGGFVVSSETGISGFLPNSQVQFLETGQNPIGKKVKVNILETNRQAHKIIFSQKVVVDSKIFEQEIIDIKLEQKMSAIITNIAPFGIFLSLHGKTNPIEGFVHVSEISWEKLDQVPASYKIGEEIEGKVLGFDKKAARVNLSIRQLTKDPFEEELENFTQDKKVNGKVTRVADNGIFLDLGGNIEGFIKKDKIPPNMTYNEGSPIVATVSEVDKKRHRVILVPVLTEKPIGYR